MVSLKNAYALRISIVLLLTSLYCSFQHTLQMINIILCLTIYPTGCNKFISHKITPLFITFLCPHQSSNTATKKLMSYIILKSKIRSILQELVCVKTCYSDVEVNRTLYEHFCPKRSSFFFCNKMTLI